MNINRWARTSGTMVSPVGTAATGVGRGTGTTRDGEMVPLETAAAKVGAAMSSWPAWRQAPCTRWLLTSGDKHMPIASVSFTSLGTSKPITIPATHVNIHVEVPQSPCFFQQHRSALEYHRVEKEGTHTTEARRVMRSARSWAFSASTAWWDATSWDMRCRSRLFSWLSRSTSSSTAAMCVARRRRMRRAASRLASRLVKRLHISPAAQSK